MVRRAHRERETRLGGGTSRTEKEAGQKKRRQLDRCRRGEGVSPAVIAVEVTLRQGVGGWVRPGLLQDDILKNEWETFLQSHRAGAADGLGLGKLILNALLLSHGRS